MKNSIDLWQGDCLELMKQLPDESVDLVVTSPPYDNLRLYNTGKYKGNDYHSIIKELYRIMKQGGNSIVVDVMQYIFKNLFKGVVIWK